MKLVVLTMLILTACGKPQQQSSSPVVPVTTKPSVETCQAIASRTPVSAPIQLTGYALGITYVVNGVTVTYEDGTAIATEDLAVGTYCTLSIVNGNINQVTMSQHPGCSPGWGEGC